MGNTKKQTAIQKLIAEIKANLMGVWVTKGESGLSIKEKVYLSAQEKTLKDILLDLESNYLPMEKECIYHAWDKAIEAHDKRGHNISRSSCDVDDYYEETYNTETDGL